MIFSICSENHIKILKVNTPELEEKPREKHELKLSRQSWWLDENDKKNSMKS